MRVKILNRRWDLEITRLRGKQMGWCDPPEKPGKKILIDSGRRPFRLLEALIHEVAHAADWSKDESWVEEFAEDLARILWRVGWRLPEPHDRS